MSARSPWFDDLHGRNGNGKPRRTAERKTSIPDLKRIVEKTPEVLFKISRSSETDRSGNVSYPSPRNSRALKGLAEYISRHGTEEMTDEQGLTYVGPDAVKDAVEGWGMPEISKRREAIHVVMGMPGKTSDGSVTDVAAVERAVEATAAKLFSGHMYLMAHHQDSESGHPHSHLIVKMTPNDGGKRLDPRMAQLRKYREVFAETLRDNGVDANATSRVARLSTRRSLKQGSYQYLKHNDADKLGQRLEQDVTDAHRQQLADYKQVASDLARSSDNDEQALAVNLVRYLADKTGIRTPEISQQQSQKQAPQQSPDQSDSQNQGPSL